MLSTIDDLEEGQIPPDQDIEFVVESIDYAIYTLSETSKIVACLESAISSHNARAQAECLQLAQIHRTAILRQYGESAERMVISTENLSNKTWLVVALEAEADTTKGILTRILDAIIKAFNWLWEKITSLFSSGESKKDATEKGEATLSELEAQIKSTPNFPPGAALSGSDIGRYLSHLGADVTVAQLEEIASSQAQQAVELTALIVAISKRLRDAAQIAGRIKNTPTAENVSKEKTEFESGVIGDIKSNVKTPYKADPHGTYGAVKEPGSIVVDASYVIGPVLTGSGPTITVLATLTDGGYKGFVGGKKDKATDVKVALPSALSGLVQLQTKINTFHTAIGNMNDDLKSKVSTMVSDGKAVAGALKDMQGSADKATQDKALADAITAYSKLAKNVGGLQGTLLSTVNNFRKSSDFMASIVPKALEIAKGKKSDGKKDDSKKEETKPA